MTKFRYVNLPANLVEEIETLIKQRGTYHSIADFVSEAVRLRLGQLGVKVSEGSGVAPHVLTLENEKLSKEKESAVQ